MPRGMDVFDPEPHIPYSGVTEGDSTGLSKKAGKQKNSGQQKYKGAANGPKKAPVRKRAEGDKYPMYSTKGKRKSQNSLGVNDRAPDEDSFYGADAQFKVRKGSGKGVND